MAKRSSKRRRREGAANDRGRSGPAARNNRGSHSRQQLRHPASAPGGDGGKLHLFDFEITWEPIPEPAIERMPEEQRDRIEDLHHLVSTRPSEAIDEVEELCARHPEVNCFSNWLCMCYRTAGRLAEARQLAERMVLEHPDYLFGLTTLADLCLDEDDLKGVERAIGPVTHPKTLFPDRNVFHISEVRHYFYVAGRYHLKRGNPEAAERCRDFLEEMEPGSTAAENLTRILQMETALDVLKNMFRRVKTGKTRTLPPAKRSRTPRRQDGATDQMELFSP